MNNEETLTGFQVGEFVPPVRPEARRKARRIPSAPNNPPPGCVSAPPTPHSCPTAPQLIEMLQMEYNPEMMLLACRCLCNMIEALPGSAAVVIENGAAPILTAKMLNIEYIDLAEQALTALEKLSVEFSLPILRAGGAFRAIDLASGRQPSPTELRCGLCTHRPQRSAGVPRLFLDRRAAVGGHDGGQPVPAGAARGVSRGRGLGADPEQPAALPRPAHRGQDHPRVLAVRAQGERARKGLAARARRVSGQGQGLAALDSLPVSPPRSPASPLAFKPTRPPCARSPDLVRLVLTPCACGGGPTALVGSWTGSPTARTTSPSSPSTALARIWSVARCAPHRARPKPRTRGSCVPARGVGVARAAGPAGAGKRDRPAHGDVHDGAAHPVHPLPPLPAVWYRHAPTPRAQRRARPDLTCARIRARWHQRPSCSSWAW